MAIPDKARERVSADLKWARAEASQHAHTGEDRVVLQGHLLVALAIERQTQAQAWMHAEHMRHEHSVSTEVEL